MKCEKCGNEFFAGTVCPNCGTPVTMDSDSATVAFDQEIGAPVPENNGQGTYEANVAGQTNSAIFSQNTPQPGDNIYGAGTANPYAGQPNNMYGNAGQGMYGNQPNNVYGNQPNNMYGNQPNAMYGNQPNNMYGGQNGFNPGTPNYTLKPEEPKKSKTPFIVAGICLGVAVIALVLILVFVVFKKDDDDDKKVNPTTSEEIMQEDTEEQTDAPSTDDTTEDTEEPATSAPISSGTLEGTVVYDDNNVQLTVVSVDYNYGFLTITGQVENKMNTHVKLSAQGIALNGVSLDGYMSSDILGQSKAEWSLSTYDSSMETAGIEKITDLTVYFELYDSDSYDTLALGNFTYKMDLETTATPKYDLTRFVDVYGDENCSVAACKDIVYDESMDAYYTVLRVENKINVPVYVMLTDTTINGVLVDEHLGWDDIIPKTVVYSEIYWETGDLTEDCMTFKDIEMTFDFFDYDSWVDYTVTTISYQTDGVVK